MSKFYQRINAIIKECIILNKDKIEEKFIIFYESLSQEEQSEFLVEIIDWVEPLWVSDANKSVFLKEIAKPVFVYCLKDQQSKGRYAVPIDLFTPRLSSF